MPRSYSVFMIALLAGGGWFFTKGPGQGKLGDIVAQVKQGQFPSQSPFASQGKSGFGQNPPSNNYGGYNNYPAQPGYPNGYQNYPAQPAAAQIPATYASQSVPAPAPAPPTPMFGGPAIRIASFNIEIFGDKKASKPYVMATLASISKTFTSSRSKRFVRKTTTSLIIFCARM